MIETRLAPGSRWLLTTNPTHTPVAERRGAGVLHSVGCGCLIANLRCPREQNGSRGTPSRDTYATQRSRHRRCWIRCCAFRVTVPGNSPSEKSLLARSEHCHAMTAFTTEPSARLCPRWTPAAHPGTAWRLVFVGWPP
jgi:hypothetical protein